MLTLLIGSCFTSVVFAADPNCRGKYITPGRESMFTGSLSGLRQAYETFDEGVQCSSEPGCDCNNADANDKRELKFLHAATQTAMLFIDSNDSFLELAKGFGVEVLGDYFESLDINVPLTDGRYKIPSGADANKISDINNFIIPEINDIIAELDSISDTAGNRFRIYFTLDETGLENNLEVDYGEVLILRGLLLAFKSQLETKLAYDVFVDVNETLLDKLLYEDGFNPDDMNYAELAAIIYINDPCNININEDFLNQYPNLLKILPTTGHTDVNGTAVLAKSKKDLLASIDSYFKAVNYISTETDNQDDDLVYIDPNDKFLFDMFKQKLTTLQNSLKYDTTATYTVETTKKYNVFNSKSILIGQMVLVYDWTGLQSQSDGNSYLTFTTGTPPSPSCMPNPTWGIEWFDIYDNSEFEAELSCHYFEEDWYWDAYLKGTLNTNGNITDVNLYYWGHSDGSLEKFSCRLVSTLTKVTNITFNLNPIFGSTKYRKPVSPRDLLPVFDSNNQPLAGTFGHGLGNDANLGGILPGMTQQDWTDLLGLSAAAVVPNVVNKTDVNANTAIVDANLVVGDVTTTYSNTVVAGKVISQSPAAGTKVAIGSPVDYVKSLGKPTVPNVVGMTVADANTAITSVNLKVGTVTTAYDNNVAAGTVISQSPAKDTKVLIGSAVNYVKSLGKKPTVSITAFDSQAAETVAGETANPGVFRISRADGSTANALTVYFTRRGTAIFGAAGDYTLSTLLATSVVILSGHPSVDITVTPVDNLLAEPNETVILTLAANATYNLTPTVPQRTATVTIADND